MAAKKSTPITDPLSQRKKPAQQIADSEWIITVQLEIAGEPVGDAVRLAYSDSYLAKSPSSVGYLISRFCDERAKTLKPKKKPATKVAKQPAKATA